MLERAANALGYAFSNEKLLIEALTHASSADNRLQSNERMEFLGDAILGYVVCEYLFTSFPDLLEGELTKIKSAVVSRRLCAQISDQLDLPSMLSLGKGMTARPDLPPSVMAAVFEAVIAAIYLDGGMEPARTFILRQLKPVIDEAASSTHLHNFKSVLQQYAQRHMTGTPIYQVLDEKGPDHSKCFEVCVEMGNRRYPSAWARSKKEAEQRAALLALQHLDLAVQSEDGTIQVRTPLEPGAPLGNALSED